MLMAAITASETPAKAITFKTHGSASLPKTTSKTEGRAAPPPKSIVDIDSALCHLRNLLPNIW